MGELTVHELARTLKGLMVSENVSLREAVSRLGWDYNAVYYRLRAGGYIVRTTLVYKPTPKEETPCPSK